MHLNSESVVKRNRCPHMQSITEAHNFIVNCAGFLGTPNRNSSSVFTVVERKPLDGEAGGVHVFRLLVIPHGRRLDHPTEMEAPPRQAVQYHPGDGGPPPARRAIAGESLGRSWASAYGQQTATGCRIARLLPVRFRHGHCLSRDAHPTSRGPLLVAPLALRVRNACQRPIGQTPSVAVHTQRCLGLRFPGGTGSRFRIAS